jgi:hypothetical protein
LGGGGFCAAEQEIWDFEGRLHRPILPYLWVWLRTVPVCRVHAESGRCRHE